MSIRFKDRFDASGVSMYAVLMRSLILISILFCFQSLWAQPMLSPLALEGVYKVDGPENVSINVTLLQNVLTKKLSLTVSGRDTNLAFFSVRDVEYKEIRPDVFEVEAFGLNFKGVRSFIKFEVSLLDMSFVGEIQTNFLAQGEKIFLKGHKIDSIYELLGRTSLRSCPPIDEYLGNYTGQFLRDKKAQFYLHKIPDEKGNLVFSASIQLDSSLRLLYHDGLYSDQLQTLVLFNNRSFFPPGKSKKMTLLCDEDADYYILKGMHISSTGSVVRDIVFKKPKNKQP